MSSSSAARHKRRKSSCKEFQCTHEGCGRTYSRAEHLQRHQLNHTPKEIYSCEYPGCSFSFVRKDLYARHKLRHDRQLQQYGDSRLPQRPGSLKAETSKSPRKRLDRYSFSESDSIYHENEDPGTGDGSSGVNHQSQHMELEHITESPAALSSTGPNALEPLFATSNFIRKPSAPGSALEARKENLEGVAMQLPGILNPEIAASIDTPIPEPRQVRHRQASFGMQDAPNPAAQDVIMDDQGFGLSPSSSDEFTSWLFNGHGITSGVNMYSGGAFSVGGYANNFGQLCPDYSGQSGIVGTPFAEPMNFWFQSESMMFPDSLEAGAQLGGSGFSEQKRQSLLQYMMQRFNEIGSQRTKSAADIKDEIFGRDSETDDHVLSLANMQLYIESYWNNFHDQLPILHRPTFTPEKVHDFLLLAVLIMGASMISKKKGPSEDRERVTKFTNFVSWNLRWQVFMHSDSHPPAKLWVIQTLLILEAFEKMNATRLLHERAHIYFPTTLSLMRRGSALTGKHSSYVSEVPSRETSPKPSKPRLTESRDRKRGFLSSPEKWWDHWIAQEAARRTALAAFILDATHAAMFGHTPTLVIHEIKLTLPCDNTLWESESPSEIGCVESSLYANGVTSITFLEGLKRILNGQTVNTSPFGRMAILAALLSVTWQMHQRDLDRSTLGGDAVTGVQERWRPKLLKALDWWKKDYDDRVAHVRHAAFDWQKIGLSNDSGNDDGDVFRKMGTLFYHIGHMCIQISMPELCVFVGITQILGRTASSAELKRTRAKIKDWSSSPISIGGVYHALQLVKLILQPNETGGDDGLFATYRASNDNLLSMAWALYYATLVLWAYGYVHDGALDPFPSALDYPPSKSKLQLSNKTTAGFVPHDEVRGPETSDSAAQILQDSSVVRKRQRDDLRSYLGCMIPPQIDSVQAFHRHQAQSNLLGKRNHVIGLLSAVDEALSGSTWELLAEARVRLKMAANRLMPRNS